MENQKKYWESQHVNRKNEFLDLEMEPNEFAVKCIKFLPENSTILEIGSGNGRDARFLSREKGIHVIANDISEEAIHQLKAAADRDGTSTKISSINCDVRDIFNEMSPIVKLDAFYARSALHLSDSQLGEFMQKLNSFLKKDGYIFIQGKPKDDFKLQRSLEIDENYYKDIDGHERRVWSEQGFLNLCNQFGYEPLEIETTNEVWQGNETKFVSLIARKI